MEIDCNTQQDSYTITVERDAIWRAGQLADLDRKVLVVTDDGVPQAYADAILSQCSEGYIYVIPQGEASKNTEAFTEILKELLDKGFTRSDAVVAVGGGVVGDLAGFAAACSMRGIDFINVPTTLLSQIDSSIGGKTGIDFGGIKNSVGAFHQPSQVIIDPCCLRTLPLREENAGLAEAIKMAATCSESLFCKIESCGCLEEDFEEIITGALLIKKWIVEQDPLEKGLRRVLNFGHTVGHAIEATSEGKYLHGECVAMGMPCFASDGAAERIRAVLEWNGLPSRCPLKPAVLIPYILHDKKMAAGKVTVVYVDKIGSFEFRQAGVAELESYILKNIEK